VQETGQRRCAAQAARALSAQLLSARQYKTACPGECGVVMFSHVPAFPPVRENRSAATSHRPRRLVW